MAPLYIRTNPYPSTIGTSRTVAIPTTPATLVVMNSGYMGWRLQNVGPSLSLVYGDSNLTAGTGALQYYSMGKEFYPVADTMAIWFRADSVAGVLQINEYL